MYRFSENIEQELALFAERLSGYAPPTVRQHCNYAGVFLGWCQKQNHKPELLRYEQLMDFILAQKERMSDRQINRTLVAIRHYYRVFDLHPCPAMGVYIKGSRKRTLAPLVAYTEIEQMYQGYQASTRRQKRNKVLLGLVIYQALTSGDLHRLRPEHIDLEQGIIEVAGSRQTNRRVLQLQGHQIKELEEYLSKIRPKMLQLLGESRPGRKPDQVDEAVQEQVFFSESGSAEVKSSIKMLFRAIKQQYPKIDSISSIRSSVIAEWLKTEDVRKVQYRVGHKYVSSTERYDQYNLTQLRVQIAEKHPWK